MKNHFSIFILISFLGFFAWAAPTTLNFQARIKKPDGTNLEAASVSFRFKYKNDAGTCTVYVEDFNNISMIGSAGNVNFSLGAGAKVFPPSATTLNSTFSNSVTNLMACSEGGNYNPTLSAEKRNLQVEFVYTGSGGLQTLNGIEINSVPYSMYASDAERLGGTAAALYTKFSDFTTCTGGDVLTFNGTAFSCIAPGASSSFTGNLVGDVSGTQTATVVDAVGGKTSSEVSLSVTDTQAATSAATASTIVKRDASGNSSFNTARANNFSGRNLVLFEPTDTNSVTVRAPATFASGNYVLTLPDSDGTAGQVLSTDGNGVTSWIPTSTGSVTSMGATAPLLSSGGATPNISIPAATAAVDGYLAAADFTTFNNKVSSQWTNNLLDIYFNTGNVGVGTSTPGVPLSVHHTTFGTGLVVYNGTEINDAIQLQNTNYISTVNAMNEAFNISHNGTRAINMQSGVVGIGMDAGTYMLSVNGDVNIPAGSNFKINGVNIGGGSIGGSGTTNKVSKFTAAGTIGDSNISDNGTVVAISTDATINGVKVGRGAASISSNTAVGSAALNANTTGTDNTAYGLSALTANTTGAQNTAFGSIALLNNTTGNYNVSMGYGSLSANTSGSQNAAVGSMAMNSNTTGVSNTAFGQQTLTLNTTGGYNAAFGQAALGSNISGSSNTAFGVSALYSTTGSNNTGIGYNSGSSISSGSNNVVIGSNNGSTIAFSSNNIILSDGAGNIRQQIDSAGLVGIGMAPSTYALSVNGDINIPAGSNFKINGVNVGGGGSIGGSGTTNKVSKFTAAGTIGDSNITDNGTSVSISTDASVNGIFIGRGAGAASESTAVGTDSLSANTTGTRGTAGGHGALRSNTTGNWNSAFGAESQRLTTTGSANSSVGDGSLYNNTTGNENTAMGDDSLQFNTTGNNNTATGQGALHDVTTGSNNSGFGYHAGNLISTGSYNVVIGSNDGAGIATSSNNVIISDGSGNIRQQIDSNGNVGIGGAPTSKLTLTGGTATVPALKINSTYSRSWNTEPADVAFASTNTIGSGITLQPSASGTFANGWTVYAGAAGSVIGDGSFGIWNATTAQAKLMINQNGDVAIGKNSASYKLDVNGDINIPTGSNFKINGVNISAGGGGTPTAYLARLATTSNHSLSGTAAIDGVTVVAGDRVLVKRQSSSENNGVYVVAAGAWSRATDMDSWTKTVGYKVQVTEGLNGATMTYTSATQPGGTLGTTSIDWISLGSNLSGNTTNGYDSLNRVSTGAYNTATGGNALRMNSTGSNNTATGYYTMFGATVSGNSAYGAYSLTSSAGANNTAVGFQSAQYSTGAGNTVIGYNAGSAIAATGSNNVLLGAGSGSSLTSGGNNVILGSNTGSTIAASSNNVIISDGAGNIRQQIDSSGRVGIGMAPATYMLQVNGDINIPTGSNFKINGVNLAAGGVTGSGTTNRVAKFTAAGAVGNSNITDNGTTVALSTDATVNGLRVGRGLGNFDTNAVLGFDALAGNTTGENNVAVGKESLYFNAGGMYNVAVGSSALFLNGSGGSNVALGYRALFGNGSGSGNIAIGNSTLSGNTTGMNNVAVGGGALNGNGTANNNTAVGTDAMNGGGSGSYNTALGVQSLYYNTTGNSNVSSGSYAMRANTTGGENSAYGTSALYSNTTGNQNTGHGAYALNTNQTGSRNVATGFEALTYLASGSNNTANGYRALEKIEGDKNIALGFNAGSAMTTGSNNVFIGSNDGTSVNGTSNNILISDGDGNLRIRVNPSGLVLTPGDIQTSGCLYYASGSLGTCVSDERLKEDVHSFDLGLETLLGINPKNFKYNGLAGRPNDGKEQLGVIAQDLEKAAPSLVKRQMVELHPGDKEKTEIKVVDYGAFTYVIINSIKDLYHKWFADSVVIHREIASVKAENSELRHVNDSIQKENDQIKKENAQIKERLDQIEKMLKSK